MLRYTQLKATVLRPLYYCGYRRTTATGISRQGRGCSYAHTLGALEVTGTGVLQAYYRCTAGVPQAYRNYGYGSVFSTEF